MNERIKKLWESAGGSYTRGNQHEWPACKIDNPEKFAELLIEELRLNLVEFTLRYDDRASFNIQQYEEMLHHELDEFKKELYD